MLDTIYAKQCKEYFLAGAANINANCDYINELNVFPVPDGDTGTNMSLTILSAAREVEALDEPDMASFCKAVSSGSLKGARGNSGVILSQLLRGLTKGLKTHEKVTTKILAESFSLAVESAYKAVMKPKEGTILTVAKAIAKKANEIAADETDIIVFMEHVVAHGNETLDKTPDMLPVLKEAGVVDSGGKGLMSILEGALAAMKGEEVAPLSVIQTATTPTEKQTKPAGASYDTDIVYGYCTEFIILLQHEFTKKDEDEMKNYLLSIGDSLVLVTDESIVKIHVHTNHPGQALEKAIKYGELSHIKVDNMREEHREMVIASNETDTNITDEAKSQPRKAMGMVAVSIGDGINEIFKGLGVDALVEGGQTMNPSTEDIVDAVSKVNANTVFIFPNNKNIVLAANQAQNIITDKQVIVIPTTTVPQGISAIITFNPEGTAEENTDSFKDAIANVATGQVTYAVRDTSVNGIEVHKNDIMAMDDTGVRNTGSDINDTTLALLENMADENTELISVYSGEDMTIQQADALLERITECFPDCDVEMNYGGQPVYYYIVSVE